MTIAFVDLKAQRDRLQGAIDTAINRVIEHGHFILGPEVKQLEADLSAFCGAKHAITCSNGTDAIVLALRSKGLKAGDAVICPSFTFAATAGAVVWTGGTPVFADAHEDTFNLDARSAERAIERARAAGLRPSALIAVDLFGLPCDYAALTDLCGRNGMWVLCDSAQGFGSTYGGRSSGTLGTVTTTSFFPAKPLGCYGDGGAVFTGDDEVAGLIRSIRVHGQGSHKYENVRVGMNGRLDTIQAAILIEKLKIFPDEIRARDAVARRYSDGLERVAAVPRVPAGCTSVWAQYTLRIPGGRRDAVARSLQAAGVPTAVYYPTPLHRQPAFASFPCDPHGLPISERLAGEVLSLPMHPYLDKDTQDHIIHAVVQALSAPGAA